MAKTNTPNEGEAKEVTPIVVEATVKKVRIHVGFECTILRNSYKFEAGKEYTVPSEVAYIIQTNNKGAIIS